MVAAGTSKTESLTFYGMDIPTGAHYNWLILILSLCTESLFLKRHVIMLPHIKEWLFHREKERKISRESKEWLFHREKERKISRERNREGKRTCASLKENWKRRKKEKFKRELVSRSFLTLFLYSSVSIPFFLSSPPFLRSLSLSLSYILFLPSSIMYYQQDLHTIWTQKGNDSEASSSGFPLAFLQSFLSSSLLSLLFGNR